MPSDKDLKRLARERMKKTGESYTGARAHIVKKRNPPVEEYAAIAGMTDAAVKKRTGRDWAEWVAELDRAGAVSMLHRDIAKHVDENYDVGGWWAQTVTVSYERYRGLREPGQRRAGKKAGGFDVNKSKTIPVPIEKLYRAFSEKRQRARWLGDVEMSIRTSTVDRSMRILWPGDTAVDLYFYAKGDAKSTVTVQHRKLPDREEADALRTFWHERLSQLSEILTA